LSAVDGCSSFDSSPFICDDISNITLPVEKKKNMTLNNENFFSTGSVMLEMSSHIKGDESKDEQPSTADNFDI
jgi:hypothetical protein